MKEINWAELYGKLAPKIKGICRRYVKNITVAEDIMHNVFEIAILKVDTFQNKGSFEGWIRRIAINECIQYLRENKKEAIKLETYYNETTLTDEQHINEKQKALFSEQELLNTIDLLPDHHKTVFNLYVLDGYKHHEIAKLLDISVGTSKSHLSRARTKAKGLLLNKLNENQNTNIRRNSWILMFFLRFNFIDLLFKKGLKNYVLATSTTPTIVSISGMSAITKPFFSKIAICIFAAALFTGSICMVISRLKPDRIEKLELLSSKTIQLKSKPINYQSLAIINKKQFDLSSKNTPVIVYKKILIRDTIYVEK